jgi:hypothetical protein
MQAGCAPSPLGHRRASGRGQRYRPSLSPVTRITRSAYGSACGPHAKTPKEAVSQLAGWFATALQMLKLKRVAQGSFRSGYVPGVRSLSSHEIRPIRPRHPRGKHQGRVKPGGRLRVTLRKIQAGETARQCHRKQIDCRSLRAVQPRATNRSRFARSSGSHAIGQLRPEAGRCGVQWVESSERIVHRRFGRIQLVSFRQDDGLAH